MSELKSILDSISLEDLLMYMLTREDISYELRKAIIVDFLNNTSSLEEKERREHNLNCILNEKNDLTSRSYNQ